MKYLVKTISDRNQILSCNRFEVDKANWPEKNTYSPKTYGYMGFIPGQGLFCKIFCEEQNPFTTIIAPQGRTCYDSTVEVFLAFPEDGEPLSTDVLYMNFEINSVGAMLSCAARGRKGRAKISEAIYRRCNPTGIVEADKWSAELLIPLELLNSFSETPKMKKGAKFYCNFYKIAETPSVEHYLSFTPIPLEKPNFHCPEFFAEAEIV